MKVVAFKAPKHESATMRAKTRDPIGPKTADPNFTAMVFEELIMAAGRTNM